MTSARIIVCSLDLVDEMVAQNVASHLVSLINEQMMPKTPDHLGNDHHLKLAMNDIDSPITGYVSPSVAHIEKLVRFVRQWDRSNPMIIHCWAGISRSTAAAFIALCALNPQMCESKIAEILRLNSPTATPNKLLVSCADLVLERSGRMVSAIDEIGRGTITRIGEPFSTPATLERGMA